MKQKELNKVKKLIKKAKEGDSQAFGKLYDLFVDQIYRYCLIKTGDEDVACDITSETFLRVRRYLNRYKDRNFRAYVYTIARNLIVDYYKKEARTTNLLEVEFIVDEKEDIETKMIKKQEVKRLYQTLSKLPRNYLDVITLRFIEGLSVKETAKILGRTGISVRVTQHRALKKLKTLLENEK
jgi:RNA polymerase sigma-70 factor (ECF subfamily)